MKKFVETQQWYKKCENKGQNSIDTDIGAKDDNENTEIRVKRNQISYKFWFNFMFRLVLQSFRAERQSKQRWDQPRNGFFELRNGQRIKCIIFERISLKNKENISQRNGIKSFSIYVKTNKINS